MNSTSVSVAEIPTAIKTFVNHYIKKGDAEKPTSNLRYDQGLNLVRGFLEYSSTHTVEELQAFTSQWVPRPPWVKVDDATIPSNYLDKAATYLQSELGEEGLKAVGGRMWWQWRLPGTTLEAEWVEMKNDHLSELSREGSPMHTPYVPRRVMFYLHGGAYYFGGVNEHRYQLQRHARKLKARVFAPEYRLAPQFPFPCGLQDALAAYLFLLSSYDPGEIIFAGDSAGGALALSLLVVLRDQRLPLPSGAILLSPWVDLTHSFPSVSGDVSLDYVPSNGFHHKPSKAWPPPTYEEWLEMCKEAQCEPGVEYAEGTQLHQIASESDSAGRGPSPNHVAVEIAGEVFIVKEQVQMYAPNHLLAHPLVSPIMQPTLGGLPPVQIITGGAELLRDEQIYIAHKMANPQRYAPPNMCSAELAQLVAYPPTMVQLQVWDHLCHVATTLSFTKPAKYMFRSIAQFGAWALNVRPDSSHTDSTNDLLEMSSILSHTDNMTLNEIEDGDVFQLKPIGRIGDAGDPLPQFVDHMIRQRVAPNGDVYDLPPASTFPFCDPPQFDKIGKIKPIPLKRWLESREQYDEKYAKLRREIRREIMEDMRGGFIKHGDGETPPLAALAGRYLLNPIARKSKLTKMNIVAPWSIWSKSEANITQARLNREEIEAEESADRMRLRRRTSQGTHDADRSFMSHSSNEEDKMMKEEEKLLKKQEKERRKAEKELERERRRILRRGQDVDDDVEAQSIMSSTKSSRFSTDTSGSSLVLNKAERFGETREVIIPEDSEDGKDADSLMPWEKVPAPSVSKRSVKSVPTTITYQNLTTHDLMPWEAYDAKIPLSQPNVQIKVEVTKRHDISALEKDLWQGYAAPMYAPPNKALPKIPSAKSPVPSIRSQVPTVIVPDKPKEEKKPQLALTALEQELWGIYATPGYEYVPPGYEYVPPKPEPPKASEPKKVLVAVHNLSAATPPPTAKLPPLPTPPGSTRPPLSRSTSASYLPAPTPPPTSALPPPPTGPLPPPPKGPLSSLPRGMFPPTTISLQSPPVGVHRTPSRTKSIERKTPIPLNLVQALHNNVQPVKEEREEEEKQASQPVRSVSGQSGQRDIEGETDDSVPLFSPIMMECFPSPNGTPISRSLNTTPAPPSIKDSGSIRKTKDPKKWVEMQGVADESDLAIAPWDMTPSSASAMSGIFVNQDRSFTDTASIAGQSIRSSAPSEGSSIPLSRKTTATGSRIPKDTKRWEEIQGVADESCLSPIPWETSPAIPPKDSQPTTSTSSAKGKGRDEKPEKKRRWKWGRSSNKSAQDFGLSSTGSTSSRPSDEDSASIYSGLQSPVTANTSALSSSASSKFPGGISTGASSSSFSKGTGGLLTAELAASENGGKTPVEALLRERREREEEKAKRGQVETGVVGKRPMLGGIALPFSLGTKASTDSMVTLHSDENEEHYSEGVVL